MNDTTKKIKDIQLAIWMSKTPEERLTTFIKDNETMYLIWKQHQEVAEKERVASNKP